MTAASLIADRPVDVADTHPAYAKEAPLVQRLASLPGAAWVTLETLADFLAQPGLQVLLLGGDPVRFPEVLDVAVVLPELAKTFARDARLAGARLHLGVAPRSDEDALAARFGVQRWPSLVWLRDGAYLGQINGMLDWQVYLDRVGELLDAAPSRPPIALRSSAATSTGCH